MGLHLDSDDEAEDGGAVDAFEKGLELSKGGIQTIPPGFERGLDFGAEDGDEAEEWLADDTQQQHIHLQPVYRPELTGREAQVRSKSTQVLC